MSNNERISTMNAIAIIYRASQLFIADKIEKFKIGRGQWYVLNRLLFDNDGMTNKELADDLLVDKASITRATRKLEAEGYIRYQESNIDLRKSNIYVTQKSKDMCEEYHRVFMNLNEILLKDFSEGEKALAIEFVYRMSDNITDYLAENK